MLRRIVPVGAQALVTRGNAALPPPTTKQRRDYICPYPTMTFQTSRPIQGGTAGAFFVQTNPSALQPDYIFKPTSLESYSESAMRSGVQRGENMIKEQIAFGVDHDGFAGVPLTCIVRAAVAIESRTLCDVGSLQRYAPNDGAADDFGVSVFSVDDVHRIGQLDCRIGQLDRHPGNLLYRRASSSSSSLLIPIDNGLALPSFLHLEDLSFCWMSFPQSKVPFSSATRDYIIATCAKASRDLPFLFTSGLKSASALTYLLLSDLVYQATLSNLTLYQIGSIMLSADYENVDVECRRMSALETVIAKCIDSTQLDINNVSTATFLADVSDFISEFRRAISCIIINTIGEQK